MSLTGFLSYSRVNWQQSPSKSTPWNATNLNVMDAGIKNNNDMISNLRDEVTQLNSNIDFSYLVKKAKDLQPKSDLNNITASGIYYMSGEPEWLNVPSSNVTNCYLIVFALSSSRCTQIILPGNDEYMYYRSTVTDQQLWQKWKQVGGLS